MEMLKSDGSGSVRGRKDVIGHGSERHVDRALAGSRGELQA